MPDKDNQPDLTDEEVQAMRERLRRAIKSPASNHRQVGGFWRQPATQWDIFKFLVPFVVAIALWAVRIEIYQTRTDARFDGITTTLSTQSETLKGINATLKDMADSRLQSRERLASIEAKVDMILNEQRGGKQ